MNNKNYTPTQEELERIYQEAANGNDEAFRFIVAWQTYCHGIDDLVDEDIKEKRQTINLFFQAATLYSSNYWLKYSHALYPLIALITVDFADSNEPEMPNSQFLAASGNNMIKAVAFIQGGYSLLEQVSGKLNKLSARTHGNGKENQ